ADRRGARDQVAEMDAQTGTSATGYLSHRETRWIAFGVLLPLFMGSIDNTILASALPTIGGEFGDVRGLPWLITIYLLAATAAMPLYGKVADIRGRRFALRVAIALHMAGSLVCAFAPSIIVLILGRAVQGLGGAGLSAVAVIVLADAAAPKERGRYYAYFSIVYTTAGACGPALGGFIADHLHWSVIFWLNIPLGLLALAITATALRRLPRNERKHRLDVIGALLIVIASVSFMLALNVGGKSYSWLSPPVLGLFAAALLIGAAFVVRLLTAPEPLIPLAILTDPIVRWSVIANSFGCASIVGLNIFPAELPRERDRPVAEQRRPCPDGADGEPQQQCRAVRPGARPGDALQGAADGHAGGRVRRGRAAGAVGRPHDHRVVRSAAVPDRRGLRAAA